MKLKTLTQVRKETGVSQDSLRNMIKNKKITAYKQDGFNKIMIDLDELIRTFKPINNTDDEFDLSCFEV